MSGLVWGNGEGSGFFNQNINVFKLSSDLLGQALKHLYLE